MIDVQAGMRHAVELLTNGAEVENLRASLPLWPSKFAAGVQQVIDNAEVLAELQRSRSGAYDPPQKPQASIKELRQLYAEVDDGPRDLKAPSRSGNQYPGLHETRRRGRNPSWSIRRTLNGREYRSKAIDNYHEAILEWYAITAQMEADRERG